MAREKKYGKTFGEIGGFIYLLLSVVVIVVIYACCQNLYVHNNDYTKLYNQANQITEFAELMDEANEVEKVTDSSIKASFKEESKMLIVTYSADFKIEKTQEAVCGNMALIISFISVLGWFIFLPLGIIIWAKLWDIIDKLSKR